MHNKILLSFKEKSLANQLVTIFAIIMLVPLLALIYDIFFASQTNQVVFFDKEQRLTALVENANHRFTTNLNSLNLEPEMLSAALLHKEFTNVVEHYLPSTSGIRFGLYVPKDEKITVLGFLHNYRNLSSEEELQREHEIFDDTKSGLIATEMEKTSLFRISGSFDDQIVEYISPVIIDGNVVAVMWAGERLNPFFYQSSFYRKLLRYFTLGLLILVMLAALRTIRNVTTGVDRLKQGLHRMERDIHHPLPEMSGELGQVAQAINRMAVSLCEKERLEDQLRQSEHLIALGRLATGVAHELRNPIGIIKTLADLMKQEYSHMTGIEEYTRAIDEQVDRQDLVIQELLDFGRPTKASIKECYINDLIFGVLSFSAAMLRKQTINVQLYLDDNLPKISADTEKLKQVFVNLIVNAAEAMPSGGNLDITTKQFGDFIFISLSDTGEGIFEQNIHRIFDPFYTTKEAGTGLGLAISYQNIKLHGGDIDVESQPNKGTTFTIKLPIKSQSAEESDLLDT